MIKVSHKSNLKNGMTIAMSGKKLYIHDEIVIEKMRTKQEFCRKIWKKGSAFELTIIESSFYNATEYPLRMIY